MNVGIVQSIMKPHPPTGSSAIAAPTRTRSERATPSWNGPWTCATTGALPTGLSDRQRQVLAIFDKRRAANRHKMDPIPVCLIPAGLKR
jgi:NAD+ synthase